MQAKSKQKAILDEAGKRNELTTLVWFAESNRAGKSAVIMLASTSSAGDVSSLQHQLAAMTRETTGKIPHGQLWQPCKVRGCDNEPVCMNCMRCQENHCHCFDE